MLYDPLAVKRLASAVCVLPPTPRSRIGTSGCQGCESSSTTESAREPGLDAGAPGGFYCVALQEEEQQRPVVGNGIVLEETSSKETLAQGKGRALGAERSSTEPFRKKDQATYLGSAATYRGGGGLCPPAAWDTPALDVRHEPASFPCWRSACHSPGSDPPASVWLFRTSTRAYGGGWTPLLGGSPGGGGTTPPSGAGRGGEATRT